MRIFFKLLMKLAMFAAIVMLSSGGLRKGAGLFSGGSESPVNLGADGAPVTKEESDLTGTVFKSALKLVTGQASRSELGKELNEKLYGQRGDPSDMAELGIELSGPKGSTPDLLSAANAAGAQLAGKSGGVNDPKLAGKPGEKAVAGTTEVQKGTLPGANGASPVAKLLSGPELVSGKSKAALAEIWQRLKKYSVELGMVPVVFLGMAWVARSRRRKREAGFVPEYMATLPESDSEKYVMKHRVQSLSAEEFELLMSLIYQRQGYRVSLSAALASGQSTRFKLARKAERLLVQCHNFKGFHRVEVKLVQELHEAMADANVTGGLFIASCGYTWDARHFAKTKNIKLISAKTLDMLLTQARATPDENLLTIAPWIPKFMTKVEMTTPRCPECEAEMDEVKEGEGAVWLCNQRPECGGRRDVRKYRKGFRVAGQDAGTGADSAVAPERVSETVAPDQGETGRQSRRQDPAPSKAIPSAANGQQTALPPKTPTAIPKPAFGFVQAGGKISGANVRSIRTIVPELQRDGLPEILRGKPRAPVDSAQGGAGAEGAPLAPASRQGDAPENPPQTPPKPAQIPAAAESRERNRNAGPSPEQQAVNPAPAPVPVAGAKRNGGLLSSVVDEFKRRGFRLEGKPFVKSNPAPGLAQGKGVSAPQVPQKRADLHLEKSNPAPQTRESNAV